MLKNKIFSILIFVVLISMTSITFYEIIKSNFVYNKTSNSILKSGDLTKKQARKLLYEILDISEIPHGDLSVSGNTVHSKRYVISQWQRVATGATVVVLGKSKKNELMIALGFQRGEMNHPSGYMEVPLPHDDMTGLRKKGASRINSNTGELVMADKSIEYNAIREVYEEIGLKINKNDLQLLCIASELDNKPACVVANYLVELSDVPDLKTYDEEFVDDDLREPKWYKVSDISFNKKSKKYYVGATKTPLNSATVILLKKALNKLGKSHLLKDSIIFGNNKKLQAHA